MNIDSLEHISDEMFTKENLVYVNFTGQSKSIGKDARGRWITEYRHGVETRIGNIEYSVWLEAVKSLINRIGENEIYEKYEYIYKTSPSPALARDYQSYAIRSYITDLHMNPKWVEYDRFHSL